ncbi:TQO small subunit DoxD [Granulicella aggregans]|uniref:TQO small subunit DoxD n=1 Tax=Granulicella aggregans TaxID=474949 RepID=UPI00160D6A4E
MGLFLLRGAGGSVLVVQGITLYQQERALGPMVLAVIVVTIVVGILLCLGFLTRFAMAVGALGTIGSMFYWLPFPRSGLFETRSTEILALVIAAAIASVGPGAFSVDARLFGRREVIIPKSRDDPHF